MQAVADLEFLEFAQVVVEFPERLVLLFAPFYLRRHAAVGTDPRRLAQGEDLLLQHLEAARVDPGGLVVLVDQLFEITQRAVTLGPSQRRGQVVDNHRLGAALGLGTLAGIVDDERVKVRRRAKNNFRKAGIRQRQRLARQPFHVAVLTEVDDRVDVLDLTQPGVERQVVVRRHEVRVMITLDRVDVVAARRLQPDDDVAEPERGEREPTAIDIARLEERICLGRAPAFEHGVADRFRQARKEQLVLVEADGLADLAAGQLREVVGRTRLHARNQAVAVFRQIPDPVARVGHRAEHVHRARRGV